VMRVPMRSAILLFALTAACTTRIRSISQRDGSGGQPGGGAGGDNGSDSGGAGTGGSGKNQPRPPGRAAREGQPETCKKGTQTCAKGTATVGGTWGPCQNVKAIPGCPPQSRPDGGPDLVCDCTKPTTECELYCKGREAGADNPPATCVCTPGTTL